MELSKYINDIKMLYRMQKNMVEKNGYCAKWDLSTKMYFASIEEYSYVVKQEIETFINENNITMDITIDEAMNLLNSHE